MEQDFQVFLEQRYIHKTARIIARILTPEEAAERHYHDGFYGVTGDQYTTYVDGYETEDDARRYMRTLTNGLLLEGKALKDWDLIPVERGVLALTLTERDRVLLLTALECLLASPCEEDTARQCGTLMDRLRNVPESEPNLSDGQADG